MHGEIENNIPEEEPGYNEIIVFFKSRMNISVIADNGVSCNFKVIKYKDFTGKEPSYRENKIIIGNKYLKMLATTTSYKIY